MPFLFFDPTMVLLIPAMLFAMWAQFKVKSAYAKYAQVGTRARLTGSDVARRILYDADIAEPTGHQNANTCGIEAIGGQLSDHYDPRARMLRLSQDVYHGSSIAAVGIAAHEVGHAIQHARMYSPLMLRNVVYPVCSIGSKLAFPLFFLGLFITPALMQIAILMFSLSVFFTVLTLPVEFNASKRALRALASGGYLAEDELAGARAVLNAAALTYVAAAAMAIMQLVRMMLIANSRD